MIAQGNGLSYTQPIRIQNIQFQRQKFTSRSKEIVAEEVDIDATIKEVKKKSASLPYYKAPSIKVKLTKRDDSAMLPRLKEADNSAITKRTIRGLALAISKHSSIRVQPATIKVRKSSFVAPLFKSPTIAPAFSKKRNSIVLAYNPLQGGGINPMLKAPSYKGFLQDQMGVTSARSSVSDLDSELVFNNRCGTPPIEKTPKSSRRGSLARMSNSSLVSLAEFGEPTTIQSNFSTFIESTSNTVPRKSYVEEVDTTFDGYISEESSDCSTPPSIEESTGKQLKGSRKYSVIEDLVSGAVTEKSALDRTRDLRETFQLSAQREAERKQAILISVFNYPFETCYSIKRRR